MQRIHFNIQQPTLNNRNPFSAFTSTLNNQQSTINNRNPFSAFTSTLNNQQSTINNQQSPGIDPRDYNLFHRYAKPESTALPVVNTLKVYPNPVSDELTIEVLDGMEDGMVKAELFDLMGKAVFSKTISIVSSKGQVNFNGVKKGMYLLKISDAFGNQKTTRVAVN